MQSEDIDHCVQVSRSERLLRHVALPVIFGRLRRRAGVVDKDSQLPDKPYPWYSGLAVPRRFILLDFAQSIEFHSVIQ
jgi:hypothetical protein